MTQPARKSFEQVVREDGRYPLEAYAFLNEALAMAAKREHGQQVPAGNRHVTGKQLCLAARDLAAERWGLMAPAVLGKWNIRRTADLGAMVFLMVDNGFMKKTDEDSLDDFNDVFDLQESFRGAVRFLIRN